MQLSRRALSIPGSITFELDSRVAELRAGGADVVGLGGGQPDFPAPPAALEAAREFLKGGRVGYTPAAGLPELREAAARHVGRICGVDYEPGQVVATCGAKEALFLAMASLADPGQTILVPRPSWISYEPMVRIANATPAFVDTDAARGFRLTPEALHEAIDDTTRAVVLNSPSNPSGLVYTRAELAALCEVIVAADVALISDEIYWPYVFDGEHVSPASLPGMAERTVVINGLSKSHAMTGWRIGFLAAPADLAQAVARLKSHLTSNISAPAQHAALGALAAGDEHTQSMREAFARRRQLAMQALAAMPGVELIPPQGAFYVFPRVDAFYDERLGGSVALCAALLEEARLAVVPGAAFGEDRCVRLSIAAADEVLAEGLRRLAGFLENLPAQVA